jgi:PAS domain S-box-containing protein
MTNLKLIEIGIGLLFILSSYFYFSREVALRRQTENLLRQQTDRERIVTRIAQHIRQSLDLDKVLATTVTEVQQFLRADRVLIYRIWPDGTGSAINESVLPTYPAILGSAFPAEVFPEQYHRAYSLGKTRTITDVEQTDVESCLADFVRQFGVQAKLVVPIIQENRQIPDSPYLWGLLIAHQCDRARTWETWEVELMQQLATQVAIAIQQSELHQQLQDLNNQLEQRVQQRTAELATLNLALRDEISERQRTEIKLLHTNHTLQTLITASPRAIFTLDREGLIKIWNPAAEQMFGWTEAEVLNQPNPIEPLEDYSTLRNNVMIGTTYSRVELCCHKKDGSLIDIIFSAAPLQNSEGQIDGLVAVIADITAQKQQAEQVRLLQSVVVNTNDAVVITAAEPIDNLGPQILYVNEAFTKITGYSPEEILGKTPRILQGAKTDRAEIARIRSALARWEAVTVEVINYRKDGSEFWNEFSIVPVADKDGWYTHWIAIQRDTTSRRQAEQALRKSEADRLALEREKELSTLKARFFSMASHEFRTPLSTALAAAQLLENSQSAWENTEKRLRNLHRIQDAIRNMVQLLDDILTINRAETKELAFNPQPLALDQLCQQLVEEMRLNSGKTNLLEFTCVGRVVPICLDEKLVRSILSNLLSNAIKYSPGGEVVHLKLEFLIDRVLLQVTDQGIGIAKPDQQQLFEPFHRGKNVRTIPGTGLGLVVVKKCVDLHQGDIDIISSIDQGTTCVVSLPLLSYE